MSEWTESLLSLEKLDRSSPELWPEAIPGVTEYAARNSLNNISRNVAEQIRVLDAEDMKLLNYYRTLSKDSLLQELRKLHDLAYKLGLEESKEMTRGRFLNILPSGRRK
ncbi:Retinal tissue protein [Nesidiocoris tenuis]|uniref:Retinal tissue protein n=1 Tax=Nesidiocoris tenuis TaxID=355587 RepID=A0ABN7B8Q2_9HEMI|nr:Retinal tissue protein [Nesidiocoris tenuis]